MNKKINQINKYNWADWILDNIQVDFERIIITINYDFENARKIYLKNYIGFSYLGHWDETTIKDINVHINGDLVNSSIEIIKNNYGENPLPGGGVKKINDEWLQINIELIDNSILKFVCNNIKISK